MPLVHPGKAALQQDTAGRSAEPASVRIADREQPYLANVPLLQDSHLCGVADWYSLVTTLLNSHWDTISSANGPATQTPDAVNRADPSLAQDRRSDWMSWGWLQGFFQGLSAQHRQVPTYAHGNLPAVHEPAGAFMSCFCTTAGPFKPEQPTTPQTAKGTSIADHVLRQKHLQTIAL